MACSRDATLIKHELIRYISSLGMIVNTVTKARGNRGFFKEGRIDISKVLDDKASIRTLVHEFAHYSNYKIDSTLKSFDILFGEDSKLLRKELFNVTVFVDENAAAKKLINERDIVKINIKNLTSLIKSKYPDFSVSKDFREFKRCENYSDLKYLLKYDKVKIQGFRGSKIYSVKTLKDDFPDIDEEFAAYINLKSLQRRQNKLARRVLKIKKYYSEPCELFARFIEGLYIDKEKVKTLAPNAYNKFLKLFNKNYYYGLREVFSILRILIY